MPFFRAEIYTWSLCLTSLHFLKVIKRHRFQRITVPRQQKEYPEETAAYLCPLNRNFPIMWWNKLLLQDLRIHQPIQLKNLMFRVICHLSQHVLVLCPLSCLQILRAVFSVFQVRINRLLNSHRSCGHHRHNLHAHGALDLLRLIPERRCQNLQLQTAG